MKNNLTLSKPLSHEFLVRKVDKRCRIVETYEEHNSFKELRLKAQIATLTELGRLLSAQGYIYEDSILSHWQSGRKTPQKRDILLVILRVFNNSNNLLTIDDANQFLSFAHQGYLSDEEVKFLGKGKEVLFLVPPEISDFAGREKEIDSIEHLLASNKSIYLKGQAGIGETALAIKIAHKLKNKYTDGVLWFRVDISNTSSILSSIAQIYGNNVNSIEDIEIKSSIVRSLLNNKKILIVLDNVEEESQLELLLQNGNSIQIIITTQKQLFNLPSSFNKIDIRPFSKQDLFSFYKKILDDKYIHEHTDQLIKLGELLGFLPLSINFIVKQIKYQQLGIVSAITNIAGEKIYLNDYSYQDKNLYKSLNFTFTNLKKLYKSVLVSFKVFTGKDFSIEAISSINNLDTAMCKDILGILRNNSLLENSTEERYRLHPAVKIFISMKKNKNDSSLYKREINYYYTFLKLCGKRNLNSYKTIESEFDNINGVFQYCLTNKELASFAFQLWDYFGPFLWDSGYWFIFQEYSKKISELAKSTNDIDIVLICYIKELIWCYIWQGKIDKAEELLPEISELLKKTNSKFLHALFKQRKAFILLKNDKPKKAEILFKEALQEFLMLEKKNETCDTMTYLGHTYRKLKNSILGLENYKAAYALANSIKDYRAKQIALCYLGETYIDLNQFIKSEKCYRKALLLSKLYSIKAGLAWSQRGLALSLKALKKNTYKKFQQEAYNEFNSLGMIQEAQKIKNL